VSAAKAAPMMSAFLTVPPRGPRGATSAREMAAPCRSQKFWKLQGSDSGCLIVGVTTLSPRSRKHAASAESTSRRRGNPDPARVRCKRKHRRGRRDRSVTLRTLDFGSGLVHFDSRCRTRWSEAGAHPHQCADLAIPPFGTVAQQAKRRRRTPHPGPGVHGGGERVRPSRISGPGSRRCGVLSSRGVPPDLPSASSCTSPFSALGRGRRGHRRTRNPAGAAPS
jgi:hypothetical protein